MEKVLEANPLKLLLLPTLRKNPLKIPISGKGFAKTYTRDRSES